MASHQSELFVGPLAWLSDTPPKTNGELHTISTSFHFFRNLGFYPFPSSASDEQLTEIEIRVKRCIDGVCSKMKWFELDSEDETTSNLLEERFLPPPIIQVQHELFTNTDNNAPLCIGVSPKGAISALINSQEHLIFSTYTPTLPTRQKTVATIKKAVKMLSQEPWAYNPKYGFLNANPNVTGSGFRVLSCVHFPATCLVRQQEQLISGLSASGLDSYGHGDFFGKGGLLWIGSKVSMGLREYEIVSQFKEKLSEFLKIEKKIETRLIKTERIQLEDRIHRALSLLGNARLISYSEFLELSSLVKLGVYTGILEYKFIPVLNVLLVRCAPEHLNIGESGLDETAAREVRATMVRLSVQEVMSMGTV